jgi:lysophospholipase L1-like esterase
MMYKNVELHGIEDMRPCPNGEGWLLSRYPERIRETLDAPSIESPFFCAGAEMRFNIESGKARVRLARHAAGPVNAIGIAEVWFGSFQGDWRASPRLITPQGDWFEISSPDGMAELVSAAGGSCWDPRLVRVILPYDFSCSLIDVQGDLSPPRPGQAPAKKILCYGSSITHGGSAVRPSESWAMRVAESADADLINLGLAGNARLEPGVAEWIAQRRDWDIAILELGINLIDTMGAEEFSARAHRFLSIIGKARPDSRVYCIDLFSNGLDLRNDRKIQAYRAAVKAAAGASGARNMTHIDGRSLLDPARGLCEGLLHPSARGHEEIARRLAAIIGSA